LRFAREASAGVGAGAPRRVRRDDRSVNDRPREDECHQRRYLDTCARHRSPATLSSFHRGRPPRNKGRRYPADPPTVEEVIGVTHAAGADADVIRLRSLIVVLWRASSVPASRVRTPRGVVIDRPSDGRSHAEHVGSAARQRRLVAPGDHLASALSDLPGRAPEIEQGIREAVGGQEVLVGLDIISVRRWAHV
jgi:hypothetical protein